jgi:hypothetical protein
MFLKTHYTNFINLDVLRVTGFPEFPNTKLRLWIATISEVARVKLRASRISKYHIQAYRGKR